MKVLKFGGTSMGSPEAIRRMADILLASPGSVLVVSAFSGVTDAIIAVARQALSPPKAGARAAWREGFEAIAERHRAALSSFCSGPRIIEAGAEIEALLAELQALLSGVALLRDLSPRSLDLLMSFGERLSAIIVTVGLRELGLRAVTVDAREIIVAEGGFGNGRPLWRATERAVAARLSPLLASSEAWPSIPVVTGFIAASETGETLTLGRGGSDFSAAILASALEAEELEIWTDVDGIMTADPRKVKEAESIPSLGYEEAMELSHFGAKVIYPQSIQPAQDRGIPIRIRNSFNPAFPGTLICFDAPPSPYLIRALSSISPCELFVLQGSAMIGAAGRLFGCLARRGVNAILISQASSQRSICFSVLCEEGDAAQTSIDEEFSAELADGRLAKPLRERQKAILSVIGERMRSRPGISSRVFHALGGLGVNVSAIAQGSSELNVSAVVDSKEEAKALEAVHSAFFHAGRKSLSLFLLGHGPLGTCLLELLKARSEDLFRDFDLRLRLVGIGDRRTTLIDEEGIDLGGWAERLEAEGRERDLTAFSAEARAMGLPRAVFVDCTNAKEVTELYADLLRASVAVVTPNKWANSGAFADYQALVKTARENSSPYLYETSIGGELPLLSTLERLRVSGDTVIRMEAMLSSTLGYLLSNLDGSSSICLLLRRARRLGLAEADPREDFSAADFSRKALLLSREAGFPFEEADISIEALLPARVLEASTISEFYEGLEEAGPALLARVQAARAKGSQLLYGAVIDAEGIRLGFRETAPGEAFFGLREAEKALALWTEAYPTQPILVRGPGAGAEVTAAGLFADIMKAARLL